VPPRLTVHAGCGVPLQLEVGKPQSVDPVDVMQKSGELYILVQCCRLSYLRQLAGRVDPALSPERVLLAQVPLARPFPPSPPPPLFWFCSETSPVLWVCPTSRVRSSSAPVLELPMRPEGAGRSRGNPGSLNFRARCVPTCQGHRPRRTPAKLAMALGRMLPSALCQGVGVLKLGVFRGSITWPVVPPVYASYPALRPCPQDSEPAWLARPSPYDSFIRYILPVRCRLPSLPRQLWWCKHAAYGIGLTLRHSIPERVVQVHHGALTAVSRIYRFEVHLGAPMKCEETCQF